VRAHGRVWIEHNNTQEQKSFGLTATSAQRGGKLMCACEGGGIITAMQHKVMAKYNVVQSIMTSFKPY
jgi:hypothetical protein